MQAERRQGTAKKQFEQSLATCFVRTRTNVFLHYNTTGIVLLHDTRMTRDVVLGTCTCTRVQIPGACTRTCT